MTTKSSLPQRAVQSVAGASARLPRWTLDLVFTLAAAALVASTLGVRFLDSRNWPTGGDSASHILYAWLYSDGLLQSGHLLPWVPEVFGGLPFLSYYFPLPFIVIAALSKLIGLAPAFKWGAFLASMLLPGAVFAGSRHWLRFSWPAALFGGLGALAFLLHEQNSIWGGNLLSTLSGEFAYTYGLLFAVLAMMAWSRAVMLGRGWLLAGLLEAASGYSHGFPLLIVGFSSALLLLDDGAGWDVRHCRRALDMLWRGHLLAFCLLGGWLWPMLEMHDLTIANDASFLVNSWRDLLPATLWPVLALGSAGLAALAIPAVRRAWSAQQALTARYFVGAAGFAAMAFIGGNQLGLADIRFFPIVWLLGAIVCGWLFGQALSALGSIGGDLARSATVVAFRLLVCAAVSLCLLGWFGTQVKTAPDWALWNHSGLDAKPQWHNLSKLFTFMRGDLWSPRLVFEHDPANNDLGSTRSLEALPMFLNHRPVLEGLYMESAVLGPAIYQLQSEVSTHPSSPLVRFPSGSLDPQFAAQHMNFLYANTLLLRSTQAKAAIEASGLFAKIATSPPFSLYRLKHFDSQLVQVVKRPLRLRPIKDWMQDAFSWFRTRSRFDAYLPYYGKPLPPGQGTESTRTHDEASATAQVTDKLLSRHELIFETGSVGQPHLIRIAYNPRWQLVSKGSLRIAGPGFMLVVPEEREIHLVYGHTLVGKLGMVATVVAICCVLFFALRRKLARSLPAKEPTIARHGARYLMLFASWVLLALCGAWMAAHSPERIYNRAWVAMRAGHYQDASRQFARAYDLRRPPAKKEEALFWWARSSELAGLHKQAENRYLALCARYHGYWVPESLYRAVMLERRDGHSAEAKPLVARLYEEYPNNPWTRKLEQNHER